MYKILALNKISQIGLELLPTNKYETMDEGQNPDGVFLRSYNMHDMVFPDSLKVIGRAGAGVNNIPLDKAAEAGIVVFNTPGANANAVKELVIAGLLLSSRKIVMGVNWAQSLKGQQDVAKLVEKGKSDYVGPEILGKKLGVIGLGAIGVMVANTSAALGMEVMGFDPYISVDGAWGLSSQVKKAETLEDIFAQCDYISIHVPLNDKTKKMINKDVFAIMKKGMKIMNFARGELVNNEDMIKAIKDGVVSAYVTDFPTEDLIGIDNIITIPHLGASTPESEENCATMVVTQMKDYLEYGNIVNSVNYPECFLAYKGHKRICVLHKNIQNTLSALTSAIGNSSINIANMISQSKGDYAYTILDIDAEDVSGLESELMKTSGVIKVRVI